MTPNFDTVELTVAELLSVPVGEQLCEHFLLTRTPSDIADLDDADLYQAICTAALAVTATVGHYKETLRFSARAREAMASLILGRLQTASFAATPTSIQVWHGRSPYMFSQYQPPRNPVGDGIQSKPIGGLWTSSLLPTGNSGWQPIVASGYLGTATPTISHQWNVDISLLRLFRIETSAKWSELCERFPRRVSRGIDLDWRSVAEAYDAIHLSAVGIVRTQDVEMLNNVRPLRSWDAESTVWLRPPWEFKQPGTAN